MFSDKFLSDLPESFLSFYMTLTLFVGQVFAGLLLDMILSQAFMVNNLFGGLFVLSGLTVKLALDRAYEKSNR